MITRSNNKVLIAFFMILASARGFSISSQKLLYRVKHVSLSMASSSAAVNRGIPTLPSIATNAKRIFWVRHGEVINPGGPGRSVYYGALDVPLSPLGELEAQAAGIYLKQFALAKVFSSPLQRAVYGGEQVLKLQPNKEEEQPINVVQLAGFTELDRGSWCGLTKEEIGPDQLARFDACDESVTPEGGESYLALKRRVFEARDEALSMLNMAETGCVVSHLQVTRCILSDALGIPTHEMANLGIATASITCIDYIYSDDGTFTQMVHFQSFKPDAGLAQSRDGAN